MTNEEAQRWAEQWIDEWNRHDVEAVLEHFADEVEALYDGAAAPAERS